MGYFDETTEKGRTVERLIQFMRAVENPSWMVELVEEMYKTRTPAKVVKTERCSQACPVCKNPVNGKFCSNCGQALEY